MGGRKPGQGGFKPSVQNPYIRGVLRRMLFSDGIDGIPGISAPVTCWELSAGGEEGTCQLGSGPSLVCQLIKLGWRNGQDYNQDRTNYHLNRRHGSSCQVVTDRGGRDRTVVDDNSSFTTFGWSTKHNID